VARSTDDGVTWTAPAALNTDASTDQGDDGGPQLATDGVGNWVAVWDTSAFADPFRTDFDILLARSTDDGATWAGHAELNTNAGSDTGEDAWPQITTDEQGVWVAVWRSRDSLGGAIGEDADILVARSTDDGLTWTAPAALNTNAASDVEDDSRPQVTTDGKGAWVATWHSLDSLGDTIGTDWDVLVARSTDNGATWTAPAALNTNAASDMGSDAFSQVTTDGQGNWIAIWHSSDSLGSTIGGDWDILVARSTDGGATWTAPAAVNTNAVGDAGSDSLPQVTTDAQGIWVAVWRSTDWLGDTIGTDWDILVASSVDDGVTWTTIWHSSDSLGSTIGGDWDILVARSTDGGATWTAPAALNTDAASDAADDNLPQLTTDAQGTWVAVWEYEDPL
jgi:Neuraminidase (sialidase)